MEKGEPGPILSIKKMKPVEVNQTCQGCHQESHNATWTGSAHERRGLACTDCHSVHDFKSPKSQLKTAREPDTCFTCHGAIRAQGLRTSHHPVREGLMSCSSCHNPHDGSRPKMIKAEWTNELCLQCHTEKRGPFFWEHAPVRENCTLCHNPHGSNHDKLLVSQQPWLCQRCHLNTRHPGHRLHGHQRRRRLHVGQQPRGRARLQELPPERPRRQRADRAVPRAMRREP